jgi:hypothetical protein
MKLPFLATLFVATTVHGQNRDGVFEEKIAPILKTAGTPCHDDSTRTVGLSLLSKNSLLSGGARQGAVTPGSPGQSLLLRVLRGQATPRGADCGGTDDFRLCAVADPIPIREVHATVLQLLGLDNRALTYLHQGRYKRLTDTGGSALKEILS